MLKRLFVAALVAACIALPARATLTTTTSVAQYTSNGVTTVFSFPYRFLDNSYFVVTKTVSSVTTTLAQGADWTMTGANLSAGGTLTLAVAIANGGTLKIARSTPLTQTCNFRVAAGAPNGKAVEDCLDRLEMQLQEKNDGTFTQLVATPITTAQASVAAPSTVPNTANTNVTGSSSAFAAADHLHALAVGPMLGANTAAGQGFTAGAAAAIVVFGTVELDTDSAYNSGTGRYTIPTGKAGHYEVCSAVTQASAAGPTNVTFSVFKNAAEFKRMQQIATWAQNTMANGCLIANLAAADIIDIRLSGATNNWNLTAVALQNYVSLKRIQ